MKRIALSLIGALLALSATSTATAQSSGVRYIMHFYSNYFYINEVGRLFVYCDGTTAFAGQRTLYSTVDVIEDCP